MFLKLNGDTEYEPNVCQLSQVNQRLVRFEQGIPMPPFQPPSLLGHALCLVPLELLLELTLLYL